MEASAVHPENALVPIEVTDSGMLKYSSDVKSVKAKAGILVTALPTIVEDEDNDFDLEEYFSRGGITVCEWPLNISEILPQEYLEVGIYNLGDTSRKIVIKGIGARYKELEEKLSC